jgi:hypothetical protein
MADYLKSNPLERAKVLELVKKEPIKLSQLPEGSYDLKDGNHRATILYYSGIESIPAIITDNTNAVKAKEEYIGPFGGISPTQETITPQQKQQALQQYSQYLDTVFPDSKVKDIVYHGTSFGRFDKFSKDELGKNTEAPSSLQGFFFSNSKATAGNYAQKTEKDWGEISLEESIEKSEDSKDNNELYYELVKKSDYTDKRNPFGEGSVFIKSKNKELYFGEFEDFTEEHKKALDDLKTIEKEAELLKKQNNKLQLFTVVLNIENPKVEDKKGESGNINRIIKSVKTTNDGVVLNNYKDPFISDVYVVFEPEQIHILGSKQDIEGFKEFVETRPAVIPKSEYSYLLDEPTTPNSSVSNKIDMSKDYQNLEKMYKSLTFEERIKLGSLEDIIAARSNWPEEFIIDWINCNK